MTLILHTEVLGSGEPIVFLHTGLQTGLLDFEYQREYFKNKFKVILPDLRGHGKSIENDFSNFFEDSAEDLLETLEHLEVESAHIVGCSLGALVGLYFTKMYPHKAKSLCISGVLPVKPENWLELHNENVEGQTQLLLQEETVRYFDSIHMSDWKQFLYMGRNEEWYPFEETKDLDAIACPVLYMVGEGNKDETKGAIVYPLTKENVHVSIIPFAGHLIHSDQTEIYTKVLELFLNKGDKV
ncbi:alpha/beta fold hydrolase [Paenisporosarcina sp.]|uniref:alpha/beta fold hydrolase n=1 Tax=Paenisporosarcina sp. TaxID=1932001 RepID=UPI003C7124C2